MLPRERFRFRAWVPVSDAEEREQRVQALAEQRRDSRRISSALAREIAGNNLTGQSVDADMQIAPIPMFGWFAQLANVDLQTRAVHKQVNGLVAASNG